MPILRPRRPPGAGGPGSWVNKQFPGKRGNNMEILIISGLSGGGKSRAASFLEDIGYYTVDNLPAEMMMKFAGFCAASSGRYDRVALVYDVRSGEPTDMLIDTLEQLKASGVNCRMLFLEADTSVDFLYLNDYQNPDLLEEVFRVCVHRTTPKSVFVVHGICYSKEMKALWKKLQADERVGITFDLYDVGLLFFDKTKIKQQYIINF